MSKIQLKNIYKVYDGGVRAVSDFNLDINDKEFIVFVGPSGCGKSTTLRMIAGLEEITSGDLLMNGSRVNDVEPKDRNIAMVFQSYALYPHMTVFQNMAFGLKLRRTPKEEIERRVKEAAKILGIEDLLNRKPKALSGGQRQRVALGRAIVREPSVFLLDEPLSNLDAKLRVAMRVEITKLQKRLQTTFIYVTHDQTEAMTMGDRIVVMKDGLIQQVDTPATLYEQPCNVFVATFLGSPQMNIFKSHILKSKENLIISFGSNQKVELSTRKSKQLISNDYIDKDILCGIRPENISLSNEGVSAVIDEIEHLGSETILYCKVDGLEDFIVAKIPTNYDLQIKDSIKLKFDVDKIHGFDIDNNQTIIGVPKNNKIVANVKNNKLFVGNELVEDNSTLISHIIKSKLNNVYYIESLTSSAKLEKIENSIKLNVKIDFSIKGNDSYTYYSLIDGNEGYFVFRSTKELANNSFVDVYIPLQNINVFDNENKKINVKETVLCNKAIVNVISDAKNTIIRLGNKNLVYPLLNIENGKYEFNLNYEGLTVGYSKQYAKENKIDRNIKPNSVLAKAYDEDKLSDKKNCVFVKIDGFDDYVTTVLDDNFTVYKMDTFNLNITEKDFTLRKID